MRQRGCGQQRETASDGHLKQDAEEEDAGETEVASESEIVVIDRAERLVDGHEEHMDAADHEGDHQLIHGAGPNGGGEADQEELFARLDEPFQPRRSLDAEQNVQA